MKGVFSSALAAVALLWASAVSGGDLSVSSSVTLDVPKGTTNIVRCLRGEGGTLTKTGEGTLLIGRVCNPTVVLSVAAGEMRVEPLAAPAVLSRASVLLDAAQGVVTTTTAEGLCEVSRWNDKRAASKTHYAVSGAKALARPTVGEAGLIDLGPLEAVSVAKPTRRCYFQLAEEPIVSEIFAVVAPDQSVRGGDVLACVVGGKNAERLRAGSLTVDGDALAETATLAAGLHVVAAQPPLPVTASYLGCNRDMTRLGGLSYAAVALFQKRLDAEAHRDVTEYLLGRYVRPQQRLQRVDVAEGARFTVADTANVQVILRKTGKRWELKDLGARIDGPLDLGDEGLLVLACPLAQLQGCPKRMKVLSCSDIRGSLARWRVVPPYGSAALSRESDGLYVTFDFAGFSILGK